ncbi:MAG: DUF4199 domain-containing protein [Bacteroidales bacterium]|nr:DUF4199 domain-containing protein [Bacteroidales bacterium]
MEEIKPSAGQSALYYGLLLAVVFILVHLVLYLVDQNKETAGIAVSMIIFIAGVVVVQLDYRNKKCGGFLSYGRAVKIGFLSVLFASFMVAVYMFVYLSYINPGEMLQAKTDAIQDVYNQGMDPEGEAQMLKIYEYIHTPIVYAAGTILSYAFMGIIVALITSIFIKKDEQVSLG